MRFPAVLLVTHKVIRQAGNLDEYFRQRADVFGIFSTDPSGRSGDVFERYDRGGLVRRREWSGTRGRPAAVVWATQYLHYLEAALTMMPRGAAVLTYHPLFCVGSSLWRRLRRQRTVYWIFDYWEGQYPAYNALAAFYAKRLPDVLYLSPAIMTAYATRLPQPSGRRRAVVPLGIKDTVTARSPEAGLIGFVGHLKEDQGIAVVIEALAQESGLRLEVVGDGPVREQWQELASRLGVADRVKFWGFVPEAEVLSALSARWQLAIAPYRPSAYIAFSDPGKLKLYWQLGLPVVTSRANPVWREVEDEKCGETVAEVTVDSLLSAIARIRRAPDDYEAGVRRLRSRYEYHRLYDERLSFLASPVCPSR